MKKILPVFVLWVVLSFVSVYISGCTSERDAPPDARSAMKYTVHGGGRVVVYDEEGNALIFDRTNSAEALERCAEAGVGAVELDFSFTSDVELVCIHDWNGGFIKKAGVLTFDEFMNEKICGYLTPMSVSDAAKFIVENKDIYMVTDVKEDNIRALRIIAEECGDDLSRVIAQIYSPEEYDAVREIGYTNIVLTLYRMKWEEKTDAAALCEFALTHELVGITLPVMLAEQEYGLTDAFVEHGVAFFVHTVDGKEEARRYFDIGASGVYCDSTVKAATS